MAHSMARMTADALMVGIAAECVMLDRASIAIVDDDASFIAV